jgi:hypothetical protein
MNRVLKSAVVCAFVIMFGMVSVVFAADHKRDKKRDGSCQGYATEEGTLTLAADQVRDRKRDRDCRKLMSQDEELTLAAGKQRLKKRDGSCLS